MITRLSRWRAAAGVRRLRLAVALPALGGDLGAARRFGLGRGLDTRPFGLPTALDAAALLAHRPVRARRVAACLLCSAGAAHAADEDDGEAEEHAHYVHDQDVRGGSCRRVGLGRHRCGVRAPRPKKAREIAADVKAQESPSRWSMRAFIIAITPCSCVGVGDQHSGIVGLFEVV